jgi:hypothetical protein
VGVRVMGDAEREADETIRVRWLESERVRWVSPEALLTLVNDDASAGPVLEPRWVVGAGLAIRWGTEAGRQYQVETKSELQDTEWVPFRAPILGDGSVQEVLLPAAAMPRQFVRVRVD